MPSFILIVFMRRASKSKRGTINTFFLFMGFSNLDGSSMHCMVHFCVFSRDIGFDQPFLVPVPTFIEWVAIPFGRNVHVHVAAKIKSLRLVVCGDGHSFYDDVFDPILGRTTRLFGLGAAILPFVSFH